MRHEQNVVEVTCNTIQITQIIEVRRIIAEQSPQPERHFTMTATLKPKRTITGFTLIELLTVIAIIGVLAGILIPAISGVRTQAKETSKRSAYRQYHIANTMYASDHKGMSCLTGDARGGALEPWTHLLAPYLSREYANKWQAGQGAIYRDIFYEPDENSNTDGTGVGMSGSIRLPEVGMNAFWDGPAQQWGKETLLSSITYPERRILIGDVKTGFTLLPDTIDTTRHDNKGMFVRLDGSVALYTQEEAILAYTDPAKLK